MTAFLHPLIRMRVPAWGPLELIEGLDPSRSLHRDVLGGKLKHKNMTDAPPYTPLLQPITRRLLELDPSSTRPLDITIPLYHAVLHRGKKEMLFSGTRRAHPSAVGNLLQSVIAGSSVSGATTS